ncbi:MAG: copper resistance system multicopper oxidase [Rickettsiales bacterium]
MSAPPFTLDRRRFVASVGKGAFAAAACLYLPRAAWAASSPGKASEGVASHASQRDFRLAFDYAPLAINGRKGRATAINGTVPAPLLRWKEGEEVTIDVTNRMPDVPHASIHWHGLLVPAAMDGVPALSFDGIRPGETFRYRFSIKQAGTYWYHSHSRFQEQTGAYGPIIIDPIVPEPFSYDRDHVIVLSDWTFENPEAVFRNMRLDPDYYAYRRRTATDYFRDVKEKGFAEANAELLPFSAMNMTPRDLSSVTGKTYTYLVNGRSPEENWRGAFTPGETVRLRFINASSMSIFDVRIPGLDMTVVMADGKRVNPVAIHEFRIGTAETYDVLIEPKKNMAYAVFAETLDRSGYALATLAPRPGLKAPLPARRPPPERTLEDVGMGMMKTMPHMHHHGSPKKTRIDGIPGSGPEPFMPEASNPNVSMTVTEPKRKSHEAGLGLGKDGWRVLTYDDLTSDERQPYKKKVDREMTVNLTENMERGVFTMDGKRFAEHDGPYQFRHNERLRLYMVNHSMMEHPMHVHGMWMQVENGSPHDNVPFKHTYLLKPAEVVSVLITPVEKGDWAFHCHLLYHMEAGMFQTVRVA